jgi:dTMP kinase
LARDPSLLEICPAAELHLFCAREVQMMHESVAPALARGATVLLDRSMLTPLIIAHDVRGLPLEQVLPIINASSGVLPIEKTLLFDVHPKTSRLRKRLGKVTAADDADMGRKGLSGTRFKMLLREGYRRHAAEHAMPIFSAERRGPSQVMQAVVAHILHGEPVAQASDDTPRWLVDRDCTFEQALDEQTQTEAVYFTRGLVSGRARRAEFLAAASQRDVASDQLERAIHLLVWAADPGDPLRERLLQMRPQAVLPTMSREPLLSADDPRWQFAKEHPDAVALGLRHVSGELADALRVRLFDRAPGAVLQSLVRRSDPLALAWREKAFAGADLRSRANSLVGVDFVATRKLRRALYKESAAHALVSLLGVSHPEGDEWLTEHLESAPKLVLRALHGRADDRAEALRRELASHPRELVDSLRGLSTAESWRWRETLAAAWPAEVLRSMLGLPEDQRYQAVFRICEEAGRGDVHVLRQVATHAEFGAMPEWARAIDDDE